MERPSFERRPKSYGFFTVLALFVVAGAALAFLFRRQPAQERQHVDEQLEQNPAADWQAGSNIDDSAVPGVGPVSPSGEPH